MNADAKKTWASTVAAFLMARPALVVFVITWLAFVGFQNRFANVPAYHDGRYWWEKVVQLAERPWFPFVTEYDAGHPPLIPWLVALLWQIPLPRIPAMHLVLWVFPALLVASVFEATRRTFGMTAALGAEIGRAHV